MPKEFVNSKHGGSGHERTYVQVGWSKEADHVEIGVLDSATELVVRRNTFGPGEHRPGCVVESGPSCGGDHCPPWTRPYEGTPDAMMDQEPFGGWFMQMDRVGINRLIRILRRARDQAYGRDE